MRDGQLFYFFSPLVDFHACSPLERALLMDYPLHRGLMFASSFSHLRIAGDVFF